ncbi:5'-methylthioadenosine/S-adenosylhomocysteine nucleosidase, partial [Mesorhizobium sp. M7A.F.Ca.AU.001.01.1.1]
QYDEGKREKDEFLSDIRQARISKEWLAAAQSLDPRDLPSFGHPNGGERKLWLMHKLYQGFDPRVLPARKRYFADGEWSSTLVDLEKSGELLIEGTSIKLTEVGRSAVERSLVMDVDPPKTLPFEIKTGPIASGNVVVKNGMTWDMLKRSGVRTVLGLEMEAATIGEIAKQCGIGEWIVIKGVMDHADPNKADRFKPFAARASAEALRKFLIGRFSV